MNKAFETYWGIDVSKDWLDIDTGNQVIRVSQKEKALKEFIKKNNEATRKTLVVLESTGGYERLAITHLCVENITIHVAHPTKVKSFAKARGQLAKSDKIDARILREYGSFIKVEEIKPLPTQIQNELASLGARLQQLKEMHHQESCRLGISPGPLVKETIQGVLSLLKKQMEIIKSTILNLIRSNSELKERYEILCSMKGIGPVIAMKLITDLPELGEANKKEIAALVGVAPITNDSGQKIGKANTRYGRFNVRKTLYMGALVASRTHPKFKVFYEKLIAAGKAPKVALVAVMRKMIVVLNAMVQSKKHYFA